MRRREIGKDRGLRFRMFLVMLALGGVYLFFVSFMMAMGIDIIVVGVFAGIMLGVQFFASDKLVLMSMGAKVVSADEQPDLHSIVDRLAAQAEIPKPRIAVVNSDVPNAFATGRNPKNSVICVTTGIMNRLERSELEAVLAHELAHVKNRDVMVITLASFFATLAALLMRMLFWMSLFGGMGGRNRSGGSAMAAFMVAYLVSVLVYFVATLLILTLSRYREYAADRGGAMITGRPSQLASALMKITGSISRIPAKDLRQMETANALCIVSAIKGESLAGLFASHPPMRKRVERLQILEQEMENQ